MSPTVGSFKGWKVKMYFEDHNPPHIHLEKAGKEVVVGIDGDIINGIENIKEKKELKEYINRNKGILEYNWENLKARKNDFKKMR